MWLPTPAGTAAVVAISRSSRAHTSAMDAPPPGSAVSGPPPPNLARRPDAPNPMTGSVIIPPPAIPSSPAATGSDSHGAYPPALYLDTAFSALTSGLYRLPETTAPRICQSPVAPDALYAFGLPPLSAIAIFAMLEATAGLPPAWIHSASSCAYVMSPAPVFVDPAAAAAAAG